MSWISIALIAYFFLGIAALGDKMVVAKYLSSPKVYAISVALMQSLAGILLLFFWNWPGLTGLIYDFATGASFVVAVYFLYMSLKISDASSVVPAIDALVPIVILGIGFIFAQKTISLQEMIAVILLVIGGVLLSGAQKQKQSKALIYVVLAALFFAVSQSLSEVIFKQQPFLSAFAWSRIGAALTVVPLLLMVKTRQELKQNFSGQNAGSSSKAVGIAQACGAVGFFLQNYAISLRNAWSVSALQGVKYLFLFVLVMVLGKKFVQLKEDWNRSVLVKKICGMVLVVVGLVFLIK